MERAAQDPRAAARSEERDTLGYGGSRLASVRFGSRDFCTMVRLSHYNSSITQSAFQKVGYVPSGTLLTL